MPPRIWRVLIMPGDTEIGLELRRSLAWSKEVDLYSARVATPFAARSCSLGISAFHQCLRRAGFPSMKG